MNTSAGILLYRRRPGGLEVLLAHPGGPYWARRDLGAWTIPKGEIGAGEDPLAAARREFAEETGVIPDGPAIPLRSIRQRGGKVVQAWAIEGDCDANAIVSNRFAMEWPPRSGKTVEFPEVDRAAWFPLGEARRRILEAQAALLDELQLLLGGAES
jgi:predicted NUDIX family NTP pyrophosphohydrolase